MIVPKFVFNLLVSDIAGELPVNPFYSQRPDRIMLDLYNSYFYILAFLRMNQVSFLSEQSGQSLVSFRAQDFTTFSTGGIW
jgi:hypothetical protein